jgi:hypothetical protein
MMVPIIDGLLDVNKADVILLSDGKIQDSCAGALDKGLNYLQIMLLAFHLSLLTNSKVLFMILQ